MIARPCLHQRRLTTLLIVMLVYFAMPGCTRLRRSPMSRIGDFPLWRSSQLYTYNTIKDLPLE